MNRIYLLFLLALIMLINTSCGDKKDSVQLEHELFQLPTNTVGNAVYMLDQMNGYVVGGEQFGIGWICHTTDGWTTFQLDSLSPSIILDILCRSDGDCIASGYGSKIYTGSLSTWQEHQLPDFRRFSTVVKLADQNYMVAGGSGLADGVIHEVNSSGVIQESQDSIIHELFDLESIDDDLHLVGYGYIAKSLDQGNTWKVSSVQGDSYVAVSFPSQQTGYVVGEFGSILKTTDGGESWSKDRNGNLLWVSDLEFQDVYFTNEEAGFICGKDGLLWQTTDGGENWLEVGGIPRIDYYGMHHIQDKLYVSGSDGQLIVVGI